MTLKTVSYFQLKFFFCFFVALQLLILLILKWALSFCLFFKKINTGPSSFCVSINYFISYIILLRKHIYVSWFCSYLTDSFTSYTYHTYISDTDYFKLNVYWGRHVNPLIFLSNHRRYTKRCGWSVIFILTLHCRKCFSVCTVIWLLTPLWLAVVYF